jgi:hypothetical protein
MGRRRGYSLKAESPKCIADRIIHDLQHTVIDSVAQLHPEIAGDALAEWMGSKINTFGNSL